MAKYENIENIGKLIKGGALAELTKKVLSAEKSASEILKKLGELEAAAKQKRADELAQIKAAEAAEAEAQLRAQEEEAAKVVKPVETVETLREKGDSRGASRTCARCGVEAGRKCYPFLYRSSCGSH